MIEENGTIAFHFIEKVGNINRISFKSFDSFTIFGQRGYGDVYKVVNSSWTKICNENDKVNFNSNKKALEYEIDVIKKLHDPYFPQAYTNGKTNDFFVLDFECS